MRILRHPFDIANQQSILLPASGDLLSAAVSRTDPFSHIDVWSVDYEVGEPITVGVHVVGTGNPIGQDDQKAVTHGKFLGTVVTPSHLVWHVWQGAFR